MIYTFFFEKKSDCLILLIDVKKIGRKRREWENEFQSGGNGGVKGGCTCSGARRSFLNHSAYLFPFIFCVPSNLYPTN